MESRATYGLKTKLITILACALLLAVLSCALGVFSISQVNHAHQEAYDAEVFHGQMVEMQLAHAKWRLELGLFQRDPTIRTLSIQKDPHKCAFGEWFYGNERAKIEAKIPTLKDSFKKMEKIHSAFHESAHIIEQHLQLGQRDQAMLFFQQEVPTRFNNAISLFETIKHIADDYAKESNEQSQRDVKSFSTQLITLSLLGIVLTVLFMLWFIKNSVVAPIEKIANHIASRAENVLNLSKSVDNTSVQLSQATTEQASSLQQTVATLDEINSMVSKTVESTVHSAKLSEVNATETTDGLKRIEKMLMAIEEIEIGNHDVVAQVDKNNHDIQEIVNVIANIGEKTKVINDIVFQTKLLSFNASVEAARAGVHGKGFAVVAEEVGNLASMSGNAAQEIATLLAQSLENVNRIITQTKEKMTNLMNVSDVRIKGGKQTAAECKEALDKIWKNVQENNQVLNELQRAAQEQSSGVKEISKAIGQMDGITQQNALLSQQSSSTVHELNLSGQELFEMVSQLETLLYAKVSKAA